VPVLMITHVVAYYLLMRPQPKVAVAGNATASQIGLDTQHGFHARRGIREDRKIRPLLTSHSIPTATRRLSRNGSSWPITAAGSAHFLVTGDKRDLLALKLYEGTKIITVSDFLVLQRRLP
jgi:hypothetical protein